MKQQLIFSQKDELSIDDKINKYPAYWRPSWHLFQINQHESIPSPDNKSILK